MLLTKLPVKQLKMVLAMPLSGLNSESRSLLLLSNRAQHLYRQKF